MDEPDIPSLILNPNPPTDPSLLSLLGATAPPKPLTKADILSALSSFRGREERQMREQNAKHKAFMDSLPEGIMESSVLTKKEIKELRTAASIVAASVIDPLHPADARRISERVGVLVAKHKRWSLS